MPIVTPDGTYDFEEYEQYSQRCESLEYKETCALISYWSYKLNSEMIGHNAIIEIIDRLAELSERLENIRLGKHT